MTTGAENFRAAAPAPAPPRPYHFPQVTRVELTNGLRVLVAESRNAPLVSIHAVIGSGGDQDPGHRVGLASLTADMLDEGAGKRNAIELAEAIGDLGASLGCGADWDASYVSCDILSRNFKAGLELFADVLLHPRHEQEELERLRLDRLTTIMQQRDEPSAIASERFSQFVFADTPYGNPLIGTEASVSAITIDDVKSFYRAHYVPANISLIITGDIRAEDVLPQVERFFGGWENRQSPARNPIEARPHDASTIYLVDRPQAVQSEIRVGHVGVPRATEDYFPLVVMNSILGGIFTSRLNLNLREKHGFTYHVRSSFSFRRHAGPFVVGTAVRNEVTFDAVREILAELRRLRSGDITEKELAESTNYLTGVFPATVQTANDLAGRLHEMELYGLPEDYFDNYRERIAAVSVDDLTRVANRYLDPDKVAIVIVGKAKDVEQSLGGLGAPVGLYDVEGKPVVK